MSAVGKLIHQARLRRDLSIKELAEAVEKTAGYIGDIERGRLSGSPDVLRAIAASIGISEPRIRDAYLVDAQDNASRMWHQYQKRNREYRNRTRDAIVTVETR